MSVQPGTTGRLATVEVLGAAAVVVGAAAVVVGAAAVVVGAAAVVVGAAAVVVGACVVTEATVVAGVAVSELPLHPETTNENVRTTAYFLTV
jgi:hypothetical protein